MFNRLLSLILLLAGILLTACAPPTVGGGVELPDPRQDAESLTFKPLVRVQNDTGADYDAVTLRLRDLSITFDALPAGAATPYNAIDAAYQSAVVEVTVAGATTTIGGDFTEDSAGEPPITAGHYTYYIRQSTGGTFLIEMAPDAAPGERRVAPLLTLLAPAGESVAYERSVQRGTPFDELMGQTVSLRELINVNQQQLDVYVFADETTAVTMADYVQPGGSMLQRAGDDGVTAQVFLDGAVGGTPLWWQWDRYLIRYNGADEQLAAQLVEQLGRPLHTAGEDALQIRIANLGRVPFESVIVDFVGQAIDFGPLPAGATSAYAEVREAYRYAGLHIEAAGELYERRPIDYVGETPLAPGRYTYVLTVADDALQEAMVADSTHHIDDALLAPTWYWVATRSDGDNVVKPAADSSLATPRWPHIRFTTDTSPNTGEAGLLFNGYSGCNSNFGTYFVTPEQRLIITGIGATAMLCDNAANVAEQFFTASLTGISYYALSKEGDFLFLRTAVGDTLVFSPEQPTAALPYERAETAAITPFLARLWPDAADLAVRRAVEQFLPNATIWEVTIFAETVQVYIYEDEGAALSGVAAITGLNVWQSDRYVILYSAERRLIVDIINRALDR